MVDLLSLGDIVSGFIDLTKIFISLLIAVALMIVYALIGTAFGLDVGSLIRDLLKFLFDTVKSVYLWVVSNFHYDNIRQTTALAIICFILMLFLFMAFNVNQMSSSASAGKIGIGSDAAKSGIGEEGSEGFLIGEETSVTATTSPQGTTGTTQPHCFNYIVDGDELDVDCGGSCTPCHCFDFELNADEEEIDCGGVDCYACHCTNYELDSDEEEMDCGGEDCIPCYCSPAGFNPSCYKYNSEGYYPYCCPQSAGECAGRCTRAYDGVSARDFCFYGLCDAPLPYIYSPMNGSVVNGSETFNWY